MLIKINIDGVIRDLVGSMCTMYNELAIDKSIWIYPEDITDYNVDKFFPLIKERFGISPKEYFFEKYGYETFRENANPIDKASESLILLNEHGHKVVLCTWQFNHNNKCATLGFLDDFGVEYDDICFTKDKWIVESDIMIDDNPEFLLDKRDKSKRRIIIDQPYNRNCSLERFDSLYNAVLDIVG